MHRRWWRRQSFIFHVRLFVRVRIAILLLPSRRYIVPALLHMLMLMIQVGYRLWVIGPELIRIVVTLRLSMSMGDDRS